MAKGNSAVSAKSVYASFNVKACFRELVLYEKQQKGRNGFLVSVLKTHVYSFLQIVIFCKILGSQRS